MPIDRSIIILELHKRLLSIYDNKEAKLIAKYFFEDLCGSEQEIEVDHILSLAMDQLVPGRPLQYVTNKAYFLDNIFYS